MTEQDPRRDIDASAEAVGEPTATDDQRLSRRQVDQDRTLDAMQALESVLSHPSPGREVAWREAVLDALGILAEATREEAANAAQPDSLLSDLAQNQPRLRNRVRGLRVQYRQLQEAIDACQHKLANAPENFAIVDVRDDLARVLTGFRDQRAKESDLLYEAYYDAFRSDLPRDVERELGS